MPRIYTIELDSAEAVVIRVALRREMDRQAEGRSEDRAWKDVTKCAESVIAKLSDPMNVTTVPAHYRPALSIEGETSLLAEVDRLREQRDQFRKMMNSAVSAGVVMDGERLDASREVERLQGIVEAVKALHRPDDEAFLARQGWAYCLTCVDESHPCETRRAVDQASAFQ